MTPQGSGAVTVVYAQEEPPQTYSKSIFAAGPTPRSDRPARSWRPDLIAELEAAGYDGVVFVPEPRDGQFTGDYLAQISWERRYLATADVVLFWVPRDMATMPALTTNVEWGEWGATGRAVLGTPHGAQHNRYLEHVAREQQVPTARTLPGTVAVALSMLADGAPRTGGERDVPLLVWRTASFQSWYRAQLAAGNTLHGASTLWTFRYGSDRSVVFSWALAVDVFVAAEGRHKTNEFVLARPDTAAVLAYARGATARECQVVLVREFRAPANNGEAYVYELPSGSSLDPRVVGAELAGDELREETGLTIDAHRLRPAGSRQAAATLSAHRTHLFAVELSADELAQVRAAAGVRFGQEHDTERTTVHVVPVARICDEELVDWATLGMILATLDNRGA